MASETIRVNVRMPAELYAILDSCVIARCRTPRGKRETITSALFRRRANVDGRRAEAGRKSKSADQRYEEYAEQMGLPATKPTTTEDE